MLVRELLEHEDVTVVNPHKVYGPESNDLALQLRKRGIDKVVLAGMSANLCVEAHLRELTEQGFEVKNGKKRAVTRKFYPGYILVHMELDNETWHVVKNTPKITGFVGGSRNPPPVPDFEIRRITNQLEEEDEAAPKPLVDFEKGEEVRVIGGAFANMKGHVEEVNAGRGKLRVMVNIFGRPTPLELDFTEVEKLS